MINTGNIIRRRYEMDMTQTDLAHRIGITKDHVCRIECGRVSPKLSTIVSLCRILKLEPSEVIQITVQTTTTKGA